MSWLNGKKTIIGTIAFLISAILGFLPVENEWLDFAIQSFDYIGIAFGGIGLAHKGKKQFIDKSEL